MKPYAELLFYTTCGSLVLVVLAACLGNKFRRPLLTVLFPRNPRSPTSSTPPRSVSPTLKPTAKEPPPPSDHRTSFPPNRRDALSKVASKLSPQQRSQMGPLQLDEVEFNKNLLPWGKDWRECGPSTTTPTGVTIGEIRALGDFPDYAELSGVPLPNEYEDFKLEKAIARPYRPFRWAYHQTMSLTKLETDWWLELEKTYVERVAQRVALFGEYGKQVLDHLPGSDLAAKELMEMALQFYCARYPRLFSLSYNPTQGHVFHNRALDTHTVIKDHHPLHVMLHNIPEDFAIMLRNPDDGYYYFRGGMICSALGWSVETKIGLQLKQIHSPIPDYKERMEFSMDRYFSKMPTNAPIQRGSWGLEVDTPLFMPPGHPHEDYRLSQDPDMTLDRLHLRVDWQTLRRLPLSGAIVFNFKGLFTPLTEFRDEPCIPSLVRKVLLESKKEIMQYKNTWHTEHLVLPALREWAAEQEKKGLVDRDWIVETLKESPWFPGWREKWRRQQGGMG